MRKYNKLEFLYIIFGSMLVGFVVCTIHSKTQLTEGGEIGIELLLLNWFGVSPAISSICIDFIFYFLGFFILNKKFRINAVIGTLAYSFSYFLFEQINFSWAFISNLLLSSIIGGVLLGIGCGLVVRCIGSCGGDDSLALILSKVTKMPLFFCYFGVDILVILMATSYIKITLIPYSILTSFISSLIIDVVSRKSLAKTGV